MSTATSTSPSSSTARKKADDRKTAPVVKKAKAAAPAKAAAKKAFAPVGFGNSKKKHKVPTRNKGRFQPGGTSADPDTELDIILARDEPILLTVEDSKVVWDAMNAGSGPNEALKIAFASYRRRFHVQS